MRKDRILSKHRFVRDGATYSVVCETWWKTRYSAPEGVSVITIMDGLNTKYLVRSQLESNLMGQIYDDWTSAYANLKTRGFFQYK